MSKLRAAMRRFLFGHAQVSGPGAVISSHALQRPEGLRPYLLAQAVERPVGRRPLVILLHGFGASAAQLLGQSFPPSPLAHWLEIAEREHVLLVAPDGTKRSWNDAFADAPINATTDDCGFISALIDELIEHQHVDAARVYVMGVSKGGMMAFRLAAELAPRLAGFSALLASMPKNSSIAAPQQALSALLIAGHDDPLVRYAGGSFRKNRRQSGVMLGIEASVRVWRELAGLHGEPRQHTWPRLDAADRTSASLSLWGGDPRRVQVGLLRIDGGGHAEPSPTRRYPGWMRWLIGAQCAAVESAELAWEFFKDKRAASTGAQEPGG